MTISTKARIFWPLMAVWLLTDCTTKELAVAGLVPYAPEPVVGDFLRFTLAFNRGAAMSISVGEHSRFVFSGLAIAAVTVLAMLYLRTPAKARLQALALALVIGGALGNLFDRLRSNQGVVDFIDIGLGEHRFWIFNVADIGVTVGALLLAWTLSSAESRPDTVVAG
ncbi:MAG: signal peptidase II [Gemmatimonadota bacterium]